MATNSSSKPIVCRCSLSFGRLFSTSCFNTSKSACQCLLVGKKSPSTAGEKRKGRAYSSTDEAWAKVLWNDTIDDDSQDPKDILLAVEQQQERCDKVHRLAIADERVTPRVGRQNST